MQQYVDEIYADDKIKKYIVKIIDASRNPAKYNIKLGKFIEYGGSPRASIGLYIGSKADALMNGKTYVVPENVKKVAYDVLRHRILINYEGQSENITPEMIIDEMLSKIPIP
jgi:MoxR-like ATPase